MSLPMLLCPDAFDGERTSVTMRVLGKDGEEITGAEAAEIRRMQRGRLIRLVRRQPVYLTKIGHADDERFAQVFTTTWRTLPLRVRRRCLSVWRELLMWGNPVFRGMAPRIEVLDDWSGRDRYTYDKRNPSCCTAQVLSNPRPSPSFMEIRFWAPVVDRLPEHLLATLIAHELCHVYLQSYGSEVPWWDDSDAEEEVVEGTISEWGYETAELDEWEGQHLSDTRRAVRRERAKQLREWKRLEAERQAASNAEALRGTP